MTTVPQWELGQHFCVVYPEGGGFILQHCDLPLQFVFGHLLSATKARFQRKRMAVHVNGDILFTVEVGQTCALHSPKKLTNRQKSMGPGAKFLLQNAHIFTREKTPRSQTAVPELMSRRSNRPAPPAGLGKVCQA
ncbi:hypothetical protein Q8A73_004120 [Channa argus]|nr:hypothetical protein Q8A73_004120 [Channa argus]